MSVIVTDSGFGRDDYNAPIVPLAELADGEAVHLENTDDPEQLQGRLDDLRMIRIAFPSSADGRGFTQAARLRRMGYTGRLRAQGHVIADQYAMARRCGFDEVEISDELAARQPEDQWLFRADWRAHNYQARLRG
ncbi:DUF934 domain-containing protein [Falsirhodobacter deserti]|uniref:DUF934 domain-containing protein n=1 Tax=Falsirhodobacter deserti TaxID=1365611 RepID=UPI000FE3BFCE|nr:DUF934 domain-containing protein [Falsirhodobacter deserti]